MARWRTEHPWLMLLAITGPACGSSGPPAARGPEPVTPVRISGRLGSMGGMELHNDPRLAHHKVAAPVNVVWRALPAAYRALGIPDAGADSAGRLFGAVDLTPRRLAGERMSHYLDCGFGITAVPRADAYEVTMAVITRVAVDDVGDTMLTTSVIATAKPRALSGNAVYCQSKGTLEAMIVERVLAALRAGAN
ncbi:MAG: hypothetical protein ACREMN_03020 [Gemmatimonadales bacterium]